MGERKEYDFGVRTLAEQLYVFYGRTHKEISREVEVSKSQIQRWSQAGEWRSKREKYLTSRAQDLVRIIDVKDKILQQLETEIQANTVHQLLAAFRQADLYIEAKLNLGKPKDEGERERPTGLTDDIVEEIRQRILGIYHEGPGKKGKSKT